jgi:hypothetical protein
MYQRLEQIRGVGLMRTEPITVYAGETPDTPAAFELAEQHGLELEDLARAGLAHAEGASASRPTGSADRCDLVQ